MNVTCPESDFQKYKARIAAIRANNAPPPSTPPAKAVGEAIYTAAQVEAAVAKAVAEVNAIPAVAQAGTVKPAPAEQFAQQVQAAKLDLAERMRGRF